MKKKNSYIILTLIFFLFSCDKENSNLVSISDEENKQILTPNNFINLSDADSISTLIDFHNTTNRSLTTKKNTKISPIPDEDGNIIYYIINYEEGGFIILAADNRSHPILAYSDTNNFSLERGEYPTGVIEWLVDTKEMIQQIRELDELQSSVIAASWQASTMRESMSKRNNNNEIIVDKPGPESGDPSCPSSWEEKGPLLNTKWGQGLGYNTLIEYKCTDNNTGRTPTGCVATAIAQIMKYHSYPPKYNWNEMLNTWGAYETSRLMLDIGKAVDMDYGCNGSGAKTGRSVDAFINTFGYKSAQYANYEFETVRQQINKGLPVILSGGRKSGWWIFSHYTDGHAWVSDGYQISQVFDNECNGHIIRRLHMNWGWDGVFNGWFDASNWNVDNNSYNYEKKVVYNIVPQS